MKYYSAIKRNEVLISATMGFPGGSVVKNPPTNAGDAKEVDSISGSGRSPGEGNVNPLQYSCLGNPIDRRAQWAIVHKLDTTDCLNNKKCKQGSFHSSFIGS